MEAFLLTGYPLVASLIIALATKCTEAVECYVCSWSPLDHKNDVCSTGNFDPLRVQTGDCTNGCETVTMKDKNGDVEMFYRNCITNEPVTYQVVHRTTKLNEERVYTCDSQLCNAAPAAAAHLLAVGSALCTGLMLPWAARILSS